MTHPRQPACSIANRHVTLTLSGFAWEAIERESASMDVSVEELLSFAAMYYIADADSGRIARRIPSGPYAPTSP